VHTSAYGGLFSLKPLIRIKIGTKTFALIHSLLGPGRTVGGVNTLFRGTQSTHISHQHRRELLRTKQSQIKNREKGCACCVPGSTIWMQKQQDALAKERKAMVGSGDRNEKIRTYKLPQKPGHIPNHRIGLTITPSRHQSWTASSSRLIEALSFTIIEKLNTDATSVVGVAVAQCRWPSPPG